MSSERTHPAPRTVSSTETTGFGTDRSDWHVLDVDEVLERLSTSRRGLSSREAAARAKRHGPNALRETPSPPVWRAFVRQFESGLVLLLLAAAATALLLGEPGDALAIFAIVLVNASIGFFQERRAEESLAALRRMTAPRARVRRDGGEESIPAIEVVPGDVLELEPGDVIPADARLISASALATTEAPLTGESTNVEKDANRVEAPNAAVAERRNMAFQGTVVAAGRASAVVVATGMSTEMGRIAALMEAAVEEPTPLQRQLATLGRHLVVGSLIVVAAVFVAGLARGRDAMEIFLTSVSLAVAAVPEGLPAIVTVALALGVRRMAKRRALVRRLASVETLGCASVVCSDKTGTITLGEMTTRTLWTADGRFTIRGASYEAEGDVRFDGDEGSVRDAADAVRPTLEAFVACNGARISRVDGVARPVGDPTEAALLGAGLKIGLSRERFDAERPVVRDVPFSAERRRMTIVRAPADGPAVAYVKGAPDVVVERCSTILEAGAERPITDADRLAIDAEIARAGASAMRVLAAARREATAKLDDDALERDLVFLGLAALQDPPRPEAAESIARCRAAGILPVMITGDHPATALAVAREIGLARDGAAMLAGVELDALDDDALRARAPHVSVYARVTAEHKLRVVRALRANGHVVAMTGDGVNDAPAVKGADIGVAMGLGGSEVTKEAADLVLADDRFATIVTAVEEGRRIYRNIRKALAYLLSGNLAEIATVGTAVAVGLPTPLLPVQLLWINLVTDGLPAILLATDRADPDAMNRPPRPRDKRILDRGFLFDVVPYALVTTVLTFWVFTTTLKTADEATARAHAFTTLVLAESFKALSFRSRSRTMFETGLRSHPSLAIAVFAFAALQLAAPYIRPLGAFLGVPPASIVDGARLAALAGGAVLLVDLLKIPRRALAKRGRLNAGDFDDDAFDARTPRGG